MGLGARAAAPRDQAKAGSMPSLVSCSATFSAKAPSGIRSQETTRYFLPYWEMAAPTSGSLSDCQNSVPEGKRTVSEYEDGGFMRSLALDTSNSPPGRFSSRSDPRRTTSEGNAKVFSLSTVGMEASDRQRIGSRIRQARQEAGLTQQELAGLLGITTRSIQNYESGAIVPYRHLGHIELIASKRPAGCCARTEMATAGSAPCRI